jgi:hypothetical protein
MDLPRRLRLLLFPLALLAAGILAGAELAAEEWEAPLALEATQACPSPGITPRPAQGAAGGDLLPATNEPPEAAAAPARRAAQPLRLLIHRFNE